MTTHIKSVEETSKAFRKKYTEDMEKVALSDLVPGLSPEDVRPDTEGQAYVIQADPALNPKAGEARMFTLDQLQSLFNV